MSSYSTEQLQQTARAAAAKYGINPDVYVRQIGAESQWNPNATSSAGAQGIAQFMPATAAGIGLKNPYDAVTALDAGAKYFAQKLAQYGGDYGMALAAYNAGSGAVAKYHGIPPFKETQDYVARVLGNGGVKTIPSDPSYTAAGGAKAQADYGKAANVTLGPSPVKTLPKTGDPQAQLLRTLQAHSANTNDIFKAANDSIFGGKNDIFGGKNDIFTPPAPTNADPNAAPSAASMAAQRADLIAAGPQTDPAPPGKSAPSAVTSVPASSPAVVQTAMSFLNTPYKWGGADPKTGFDCSGLMQYVYGQQGVQLPRVAQDQYNATQHVAKGELQPGDIVFFTSRDGATGDAARGTGAVGHNGMYIGNGHFVHSPHTGDVVKTSSLDDSYYAQHYVGAGRPQAASTKG